MQTLTLRELEQAFQRERPSNRVLEAFYERRRVEVAALKLQKGPITPRDLATLDRLGRCAVANTLWTKCDEDARWSLLDDEHHWVRSTAMLARDR